MINLVEKMQVYKAIHKGQRMWIFEISTTIATADLKDKSQIESIRKEMKAFYDHLVEHVDNEERIIHPLLDQRAPGSTIVIAAEHKVIHKDVERVLSGLDALGRMPDAHETYRDICYEVYLAWNRFVFIYLRHIDIEEEQLQHILLGVCSAEELFIAFKSIVSSLPPESLMSSLRIMFLGNNDEDVIALLNGTKNMLPPEKTSIANKYAASLLGPTRWARIGPRLI